MYSRRIIRGSFCLVRRIGLLTSWRVGGLRRRVGRRAGVELGDWRGVERRRLCRGGGYRRPRWAVACLQEYPTEDRRHLHHRDNRESVTCSSICSDSSTSCDGANFDGGDRPFRTPCDGACRFVGRRRRTRRPCYSSLRGRNRMLWCAGDDLSWGERSVGQLFAANRNRWK